MGWDRIFDHYVKELQLAMGINIQNKVDIRYGTILGEYVKATFELSRLRHFTYPFDLDDKDSLAATILNNIKEEENIATQRAPILSDACRNAQRLSQITFSLARANHY